MRRRRVLCNFTSVVRHYSHSYAFVEQKQKSMCVMLTFVYKESMSVSVIAYAIVFSQRFDSNLVCLLSFNIFANHG